MMPAATTTTASAGATTPLAVLRAARALLADPARWCRSAPARTLRPASRRHPTEWVRCAALDAGAMRWCAAGALVRTSGIATAPPGMADLERAALARFGLGVGRLNDDPRTPHAAVLQVFDAAIAQRESLEGVRA
jgi:hypothetical protein